MTSKDNFLVKKLKKIPFDLCQHKKNDKTERYDLSKVNVYSEPSSFGLLTVSHKENRDGIQACSVKSKVRIGGIKYLALMKLV